MIPIVTMNPEHQKTKQKASAWTRQSLQNVIRSKMADYRLIIVSNRQPYEHMMKSGKVVCKKAPGGLVTALDPVMQAAKGIWIATGSSDFDRKASGKNNKVKLPPEDPKYTLKRIFLTKEERDAYYYGYSNEGLWPLAHMAYARPSFSEANWRAYEKVNKMFADAILKEVGDEKAFIWVQDFHLTLVAKYLREANKPNIVTSLFWHIPWPNQEVFHICPQAKEILAGLLSYNLLGFQIRHHCDNFLSTADQELECRVDREKKSVTFQDHETLVKPFPISVDFDDISAQASSKDIEERMDYFRKEYHLKNQKLIVGVDRLDYTKGIPERLDAMDRFLEKYPQHKGKFVFYQFGQISRIHIPRYRQLNDEVNHRVEEINWRHSQGSWVPIVLIKDYLSYQDVLALYRLSEACIVSSLDDGMNLVAKEYTAARNDLNGSLILSRFTGAARELTDALLINPYDTEAFADSIHQAFTLSRSEKKKHMKKMRRIVSDHNIYRWAGQVLSQLLSFKFDEDNNAS